MMNMNRYQAPPPEPNNDEAFLNLLSSQRELLNQLNRETAERQARAAAFVGGGGAAGACTTTSDPSNHHSMMTMMMMENPYQQHHTHHHSSSASTGNSSSFGGVVSPNRSICETSAFHDDTVVYSKRFSMGLGNNDMLAPSSFTFGDDSFTKLGGTPLDAAATCGGGSDLDFMGAGNSSSNHSNHNNKNNKRGKDDLTGGLDDVMSFTKKRRLSGAGLFNSLSLFVENAEQQKQQKFQPAPYRRLSMSPLGDRGLQLSTPEEDEDDEADDYYDEEEEPDFFVVAPAAAAAAHVTPLTPATALQQIPLQVPPPPPLLQQQPPPPPPPRPPVMVAPVPMQRRPPPLPVASAAKPPRRQQQQQQKGRRLLLGLCCATTGTTTNLQQTRETMMSLSSAMEKSQKSQQDIHDWDRKMGLKRSHSKTMRLSTRSRKKLRAVLKKQINALASSSNNKKRC